VVSVVVVVSIVVVVVSIVVVVVSIVEVVVLAISSTKSVTDAINCFEKLFIK